MKEWVIIGGGIQGCTAATYLIKHNIVSIHDLMIIDPHEEPLMEWKWRTKQIGMEFLRSPSVHHIDVNPYSLQKYAKSKNLSERFFGPYKRPGLQLFNDHSEEILKEVEMNKAWLKGTAKKIKRINEGWEIQLSSERIIICKHLILALNIAECTEIPSSLKENNHCYHVFDPRLDVTTIPLPVTVVGGGITAAHLVIKLASMYPGKVTLQMRHSFRVKDFDSDPGWLGPKLLTDFHKLDSDQRRREVIQQARNRGSVTGELYRKVKRLIQDRKLSLQLIENDERESIDKEGTTIFATGFQYRLKQKAILSHLIQAENLPCSECGYPLVSEGLEWAPCLHVMGALAELEIGPIARNISGARHAAERIVNVHKLNRNRYEYKEG
ncbi:FAD/NAD(P)-binding protein [Bacillus weihaiensis]|uniref:FAD-dependent urate hydroxylase HpyO/Asp monooxygenase CreE-like FAD/NAD(P)-binding domain-containing protein n=1 Tax=Bacillus weihaiensis TaxID=1547283 RepID=A0A1L3MMZ3_9BACI|nr:FAD/NAD(P)-binding protein [Bacillus weihaiensis]APH03723.1 hypothetical protein A9C19_02520 [Bacillus weihaiensis]